MKRTTNYDLIVVEGSDKVNLLTQMNPNTEKIDEVMKNNEKNGIHIATELLSGTVHAITRTVQSASMFKFTAVSNYTAGDTFTVDGVQVTALLTSGEALGTGAFIIGSEVLCSLKDTLLTVYTQGGTVKLADDSEKLGGNLPEYYAKQSDLLIVKNTADSTSSLSRTNTENINSINNSLNYIHQPILGLNNAEMLDACSFYYNAFEVKVNIYCRPIDAGHISILNVGNLKPKITSYLSCSSSKRDSTAMCQINNDGQIIVTNASIGEYLQISGSWVR